MRSFVLAPTLPDHSRAHQPPCGAATDASAARSLAPSVPPSAPRFCALPAAAIPRNTSSMALPDRRALRLAPGHPYMPQSVSLVGLARSVCPQNNSIPICFIYNTVVLKVKAVTWLRKNFEKALNVDELASMAGMSRSTLHHHFRGLTAMSPLQFQKQLRLHTARQKMLTEELDAANAAFAVGYESPSQFNREYKRLFGKPPKRDVQALRASL